MPTLPLNGAIVEVHVLLHRTARVRLSFWWLLIFNYSVVYFITVIFLPSYVHLYESTRLFVCFSSADTVDASNIILHPAFWRVDQSMNYFIGELSACLLDNLPNHPTCGQLSCGLVNSQSSQLAKCKFLKITELINCRVMWHNVNNVF